jgi:glutamate transport system substrate-binding protein
MTRHGVVRRSALLLGAGTLVLAVSCGKSGSPTETSTAPTPSVPVAANVTVPGSATFATMTRRGHVVIGVKDDQPGLGYKDATTGEYSGFDIDIARLISAQLGFDPKSIEYKPVPSASREQAIKNGDVDYYVGTYTINDKRKQQVSFAGPYFVAGQDLLVRKDDNTITGPDTLKGKKVCSVTGSTPIQYVQSHQLTEPQNIVQYQKYSDCVTALEQNSVDVVTTDDAILKGYAAQEPDKLKVVGKPFTQEPYGVGLAHDDAALRGKIDDILQAALADGTWQRFYDETLGRSGATTSKPTVQRY